MNEIVKSVDDLQRISNVLAGSRLFPGRGSQEEQVYAVAAKIIAGQELGFGAVAAQTAFHVIDGKPVLSANAMATLLARHPRYDYSVEFDGNEGCTVTIYRLSQIEGHTANQWRKVGESTFTIKDAERGGVAFKTKQGYPTNWVKFPRNMLFARAISNAFKWFAPDATYGMTVYSEDELTGDGVMVDEIEQDFNQIVEDERDAAPILQGEVMTDEEAEELFVTRLGDDETLRKKFHATGTDWAKAVASELGGKPGEVWDKKREEIKASYEIESTNDLDVEDAQDLIDKMTDATTEANLKKAKKAPKRRAKAS